MAVPSPVSRPTPPGGLWPALTPAAGTTPGQLSGSRQETTSQQVKSPRNQGNPSLERGHRTDCRSLTHTIDTQPTEPLHAPIPLNPSQVDSADRCPAPEYSIVSGAT